MGDPRAGQQHRDPHLSDLHHDLGSEPARRVEDLVAAADVVQPHLARDRVRRVVAPDVLDEGQDPGAPAERAAVHRSRLAVDLVVRADLPEEVVDEGLAHPDLRDLRVVDHVDGATEYRALPAAGGHRAAGELLLEVDDSVAGEGANVHRLEVPVDLHRLDVGEPLDEPLVAQVPEGERLGVGPERHQSHDLAVVHLEGEGRLARDMGGSLVPVLVDDRDLMGGREPRLAHAGAPRRGRFRGGGRRRPGPRCGRGRGAHAPAPTTPANGSTSTSLPGSTPSLSRGSTMKQFASCMELRIPDPCPPVLRTTSRPASS